jgi:hypothetical protein
MEVEVMKKDIKTQDLVVMFTVQHLTLREIAAKFKGKITHAGISKRLHLAGIEAKKGTWAQVHCELCGKEFDLSRSRWKRSERHYCSDACYFAIRENPNYVPWRYGQMLARAIVGQHFRLEGEMVVHHEDGNNRNNDLGNLRVFLNQAEHMKYHHKHKAVLLWDGRNPD